MTSAIHVPAWKKLGLKLKNDEHASSESNDRKHASMTESGNLNGGTHYVGPETPNGAVNNHQLRLPAIKSLKPSANSDRPTSESSPNPRKRKSVSFTPETKTSDGLGWKHLYDQFLITHPNGKRPTFKPVVGTNGLSTFDSLDDSSHKSKKAKKSKHSKDSKPDKDKSTTQSPASLPILPTTSDNPSSDTSSQRPSKSKHHHPSDELAATQKQSPKTESTPTAEAPITKTSSPPTLNSDSQPSNPKSVHLPSWLEYLFLYETEPTAWKFSKTKQTNLLKRTFDLEKLPFDWDPALMHYWENCKGDNVRAKLKEMAEKVIIDLDVEDQEPAEEKSVSLPLRKAPGSLSSPRPLIPVETEQSQNPADSALLSAEAIKALRAAERAPDNRLQHIADFDAEIQRRNAEYDKALIREKQTLLRTAYEREEKQKECDPAWKIRLLRRKRAERILNALAGTKTSKNARSEHSDDEDNSGTGKADHGIDVRNDFGGYEKPELFTGTNEDLAKLKIHPLKKFSRKRKRRTGVPDDDSDSSDAWGLGSGGEEDLGGPEMQRVGVKKAGGWTGEGKNKDMEGKLREIKRLKDDRQKEVDAVSVADTDATSSGKSYCTNDEVRSEESSETESGSSESSDSD